MPEQFHSRRGIVMGAVGVAAAGVFSTAAAALPAASTAQPSPEALEWRRLKRLMVFANEHPECVEQENEEGETEVDRLCRAMHAAEEEVWAQPMRTWDDVIVRAEIALDCNPLDAGHETRSIWELAQAVIEITRGGTHG
jgi:hypothetical protein